MIVAEPIGSACVLASLAANARITLPAIEPTAMAGLWCVSVGYGRGEIADAMVDSGMRDAGYVYVNIDDGWQGQRGGPCNAILPNEKFPDMKALCNYIHSLGLKAGIYGIVPSDRSHSWFEPRWVEVLLKEEKADLLLRMARTADPFHAMPPVMV